MQPDAAELFMELVLGPEAALDEEAQNDTKETL
jgi:hypothetical protein